METPHPNQGKPRCRDPTTQTTRPSPARPKCKDPTTQALPQSPAKLTWVNPPHAAARRYQYDPAGRTRATSKRRRRTARRTRHLGTVRAGSGLSVPRGLRCALSTECRVPASRALVLTTTLWRSSALGLGLPTGSGAHPSPATYGSSSAAQRRSGRTRTSRCTGDAHHRCEPRVRAPGSSRPTHCGVRSRRCCRRASGC